jgi:hypothetical protein
MLILIPRQAQNRLPMIKRIETCLYQNLNGKARCFGGGFGRRFVDERLRTSTGDKSLAGRGTGPGGGKWEINESNGKPDAVAQTETKQGV